MQCKQTNSSISLPGVKQGYVIPVVNANGAVRPMLPGEKIEECFLPANASTIADLLARIVKLEAKTASLP